MKEFTYLILGLVVLIGIGYGISKIPAKAGQYDEFATCVADSGATFWGAFWCPHCKEQKALFGSSARLLPYIECSTPDGRGQTQECKDANIEGYPTWDFVGSDRLARTLSLDELSEITGCPLPN